VIVAGHYKCGGVIAALGNQNLGPLEAWLSKIRRLRFKHADKIDNLSSF